MRRYSSGKYKQQKGLALVLVLWILSLLMIMAASFSLTMNRETASVIGIKRTAEALAAAESGIAVAEMMLLNPDQNKRWRSDGSVYQLSYLGALVRVRLLAETGKIDLNKADQVQLQSLMTQAPVDSDQQTALTGAILDWRDPDDLVNIDGAEKNEYKAAGLKYAPRNKPFQSIEELQMVLGMDAAVFSWLRPLVTVYSGSSRVDLSQASKEVLLTIPGLDTSLIDQYIEMRRQSAINGVPVPPFPLGAGLTSGAAQSNIVEIISEAQLDDGSATIIKAVVTKSQDSQSPPFRILNWQREDRGDFSLFSEQMSAFLVTQHAET